MEMRVNRLVKPEHPTSPLQKNRADGKRPGMLAWRGGLGWFPVVWSGSGGFWHHGTDPRANKDQELGV